MKNRGKRFAPVEGPAQTMNGFAGSRFAYGLVCGHDLMTVFNDFPSVFLFCERFMDMNCKMHDFYQHHSRVYRCKQCGLLELTDYFLGDLKIKHSGSFIDGVSYVWHPEIMQSSQIEKFAIGFGDCPIVNISFSGNTLTIHNTINGSRDGWMSFPDGFFDEKSKELNGEQIKRIRSCLEELRFEQWHTPQYVFKNAGACGFCINAYFHCTFPDGREFVCEEPESPDFDKLVSLMKELIR